MKDYSQKTNWKGKPPKQGTPERAAYDVAKAAYFSKVGGKASITSSGKVTNFIPKADLVLPEDNPNETDAERVLRISDRFDTLNTYATAVSNGKCRALIVSGAPGMSKSYTLERVMEHAKEYKGLNYVSMSGMVTPPQIYKTLEQYSGKKDVIILDDSDGVFKDETSVSLLKAATDTKAVRKITYKSSNNEGGDSFNYEGSLIFVTNLPFLVHIDRQTKYSIHMQALLNRAVYLDLQLHTNRDKMAWIAHIVEKVGLLLQHDLDKEQQKYIVDFMRANRDEFTSLSLRTALLLANHFKLVPKAKFETSAAHLFMKEVPTGIKIV